MSLTVHVRRLSGELRTVGLSSVSRVVHLKVILSTDLHVKVSDQRLICGDRVLGNDEQLRSYAREPDWLVIGDVLSEYARKRAPYELTLDLVELSKVCHVCNADAHRFCECRMTRYCSQECQLADWSSHSPECLVRTARRTALR